MPKKDRLTRIIEDLIQKSEAATPGPWEKSGLAAGYIICCEKGRHEIIASVVEYAPDGSIAGVFDNAEANAAYIAACTPETVREICKALGRARSDIAVHKSTMAELEAKIEEQQRELARTKKELAACHETIDALMDPNDDTGKVARLVAEKAEHWATIERLEKEADWLACKIICACRIGRQCDFGLGRKCKSCAENKSPADWRKAASEAVSSDRAPETMPLRGERVAWTSKDKA